MKSPLTEVKAESIDLITQATTVVVLDLETTGLDHRSERIIEIGAVKLVNDEPVERFSTLVKPDVPIRHSSFMVHHISEEMVAEAPAIEEVLPQILEFMGDAPMVAHNAIFDYSFLNEASKRLLEKRIPNPRIDTYEMYKSLFPEEVSHGLSSMLARFGMESTEVLHRALDDAEKLAQVYPKIKKIYLQQNRWQLSQLQNIEYLLERYIRLQKSAQSLQAEIADLKEVFKLYFNEGGQPVQASNGEVLTSGYRRHYEYDDGKLRQIIADAGLEAQAYKVNARYIDKVVDRKLADPDVIDALKDARLRMFETRQVTMAKPYDKPVSEEAAPSTEEPQAESN